MEARRQLWSLTTKALCILGLVSFLTSNLEMAVQRSTSWAFPQQDSYGISPATSSNSTQQQLKFYVLPTPEVTEWLLGNHTDLAYTYYDRALNEDQAELWLHRGFLRHPSRTLHPDHADVFLVCGYLHFNYYVNRQQLLGGRRHKRPRETTATTNHSEQTSPSPLKEYAAMVASRVIDSNKPHLIAIPTTNPGTSRYIGVRAMVKALQRAGVQQVWSLGFERNKYWQGVTPDRIVPIPYVVHPQTHHPLPVVSYRKGERQGSPLLTRTTPIFVTNATSSPWYHWENRTSNFVFYAGDRRPHAMEWSGCDRSMVTPLESVPNMDVRLIDQHDNNNRLSQDEYNHRMVTSDYCLILCGDSPTSRSLTSAMVHGCIPVRVGSRLRGICEPPCHKGWGWSISGQQYPHLMYSDLVDWEGDFPEVDEASFINNPATALQSNLFRAFGRQEKDHLRDIMSKNRPGFVYGWGNPVNATQLGEAVPYIWQSFLAEWSKSTLIEYHDMSTNQ